MRKRVRNGVRKWISNPQACRNRPGTQRRKWIRASSVSNSLRPPLYFLFTLLVKSLFSVAFYALSCWNLYFRSTLLVKSLLSVTFEALFNEISTVWSLSDWNLYFSRLFNGNLYFLSLSKRFPIDISTFYPFLNTSLLKSLPLTLRVHRRPHRKISFGVIQRNLLEGRCSLVPKTAELGGKLTSGKPYWRDFGAKFGNFLGDVGLW